MDFRNSVDIFTFVLFLYTGVNKKLKNSNGNMKKTWDIINKSKKKKEN